MPADVLVALLEPSILSPILFFLREGLNTRLLVNEFDGAIGRDDVIDDDLAAFIMESHFLDVIRLFNIKDCVHDDPLIRSLKIMQLSDHISFE